MAIQAIVSFAALGCLLVGWIKPFPDNVNDIIYNQVFYILVGASFVLQAPTLSNTKLKIPMYIAAGLCIVGAFLPLSSGLGNAKTIGLIGGVLISLFGRNRNVQR